MTDARLMEADCIHGIVWYECADCCAYLDETVRAPGEVNEAEKPLVDNPVTPLVHTEDR